MDTNRLPKEAIKYKTKMAITCTENGHKHTTEISSKIKKWLPHVQRLDTKRQTKQALQYKPKLATICTDDGHKHTNKQEHKYKTKVATTFTEHGQTDNKASTRI